MEEDSSFEQVETIKPKPEDISDLQRAIMNGETDKITQILSVHESLANKVFEDRTTPLGLAAEHNQPASIRCLHSFGAEYPHSQYFSLLLEACASGYAEVVDTLLELYQLDPNKKERSLHAWFRQAPVHRAASAHHLSVLKVLKKYGANMDEALDDGQTPLLLASRYVTSPEIIKFLLECGVNVDVVDDSGRTALINLCFGCHLSCVKVLVEQAKPNLSFMNRNGLTAMKMAESENNTHTVSYLWTKGVDPTFPISKAIQGRLFHSIPKLLGRPKLINGVMCSIGSKVYIWAQNMTKNPSKFLIKNEKKDEKEEQTTSMDENNNEINNNGNNGNIAHLRNQFLNNRIDSGEDTDDDDDYDGDYDDFNFQHANPNLAGDMSLYCIDFDDVHFTTIFPSSILSFMVEKQKNAKLTLQADSPIQLEKDGLEGFVNDSPYEALGVAFVPHLAIADTSFSSHTCPYSYFEVSIIDPGAEKLLSVGLIPSNYKLGSLPGWNINSFGLHGDDGKVFSSDGSGIQRTNQFKAGDVIGCGIDWDSNLVFFVHNGLFLGYLEGPHNHELFATVGVYNPHCRFRINFGKEPFLFDLQVPTLNPKPVTIVYNSQEEYEHLKKRVSNSWLIVPDQNSSRSFNRIVLRAWKDSGNLYSLNFDELGQAELQIHPMPVVVPVFKAEQQRISAHTCLNRYVISFDRLEGYSSIRIMDLAPSSGSIGLTEFYSRTEYKSSHEDAPHILYCESWKSLCILLDDIDWKFSHNFVIQDKLYFVADQIFLVIDPLTGQYEERTIFGNQNHRISSICLPISSQKAISLCGRMINSNSMNSHPCFDTVTGAWSYPEASGVITSKKHFISACVVQTKSTVFDSDHSLTSINQEPVPLAVIYDANATSLEVIGLGTNPEPKPLLSTTIPEDMILHFPTHDGMSSVKCHKVIMYSRSSMLRRLLEDVSETNDSHLNLTLSIPQTTKTVMEVLMYYLYCDEVPIIIETNNCSRETVDLANVLCPEHVDRLTELFVSPRSLIASQMDSNLEIMYNNPKFSDLQLIVKNQDHDPEVVFHTHKIILCSRSAYWHSMCYSGMEESGKKTIHINGIDPTTFGYVLSFVYSMIVPYAECSDVIPDMFTIASKYQIPKLLSNLETAFLFNLTTENVVSIMLLASQHLAHRLTRGSAQYIREHHEEVMHSPDYIENRELVEKILSETLELIE